MDRDNVAIPALLATVRDPHAPRAARPAHEHGSRRRNRLGARNASLRAARGLRRGSRAPVPRAGNARAAWPTGLKGDLSAEKAIYNFTKAIGKGLQQGHVEDGHFDLHVLHRRADFRSGRPGADLVEQVFHGHDVEGRRHRPLRGRGRSDPPASRRVRRQPGPREHARRGRRVRVPRARRRAHVDAGCDRQAAAFGAQQLVPDVQGIRASDQRPDASVT